MKGVKRESKGEMKQLVSKNNKQLVKPAAKVKETEQQPERRFVTWTAAQQWAGVLVSCETVKLFINCSL